MMIAISAVLSLVTIISIYREGGILKRLRATPLRPQTILSAHVLVKLMLIGRDAVADGAGRQALLSGDAGCAAARVHGRAADQHREHSRRSAFVIASIVPTARFAQPIGARHPVSDARSVRAVRPAAALPPALQAVARVLPLTYAVSLLQGIWKGDAWSAHLGDVGALAMVCVVGTALSARVFRWE